VTAVCGADKNGPPMKLTTPNKQRAETVERRPRSRGELRSSRVSSEQRRVGRRGSDASCSAELELSPPAPSSTTRAKTHHFEDEDYRSEQTGGPLSLLVIMGRQTECVMPGFHHSTAVLPFRRSR